MNNATTFTKLKNGEWGVRVSGSRPSPGSNLTVNKKDGSSTTVTVKEVLWSGKENGLVVTLCSINSEARRGGGRGFRRGSRRCPTGGNCSSFGSGRSCGAPDCDGY